MAKSIITQNDEIINYENVVSILRKPEVYAYQLSWYSLQPWIPLHGARYCGATQKTALLRSKFSILVVCSVDRLPEHARYTALWYVQGHI